MTGVVALALAFAALRTASDFWYGTTYTFTVVLLLWSVVASRFGFAVFGWGFFLLGSSAGTGSFDVDGDGEGLNKGLLPIRLVLFLVPILRTETSDLEAVRLITANTIGIGYLLTTLALALVGGLITDRLRHRRRGAGSGPRRDVLGALILLAAVALGVAASVAGAASRPSVPFFPPEALSRHRTAGGKGADAGGFAGEAARLCVARTRSVGCGGGPSGTHGLRAPVGRLSTHKHAGYSTSSRRGQPRWHVIGEVIADGRRDSGIRRDSGSL
jgi:hypothetical protein